MNNQKLILSIGFILLAVIGYQGYLLYQKDHPKNPNIIEKKIIKKGEPQININIDKTPIETTKPLQNSTLSSTEENLTDIQRRKLDEENIAKSIQNVFKSIFASKDVQDGLKEFQSEAQKGIKELQTQLQDLPAKLDNLSREMKSDPFFSQLINQLQAVNGKKLEDKGDYYYLQTALPKGKDSKVDIQTKGHYLTIKIEDKVEETTTNENTTMTQSSTQMHQETILIPQDALIEKLQTKYENGLLEITIPKIHEKVAL